MAEPPGTGSWILRIGTSEFYIGGNGGAKDLEAKVSMEKAKKAERRDTEVAEKSEAREPKSTQERFIAQKACDAKPSLTSRPDAP